MDVAREDIDKLTAAIQGMTGSLGRMSSGVDSEREKAKKSLRASLGEYTAASKQRSRAFNNSVISAEDQLGRLTGTLRDTTSSLRRMMGGVFGGALVGLVLERGTKMARTFSDLNEVGQNFGGSMLKMHQAAANAGLPLADFAELVKKNGEAMAKMGTDDFGKLASNVRNLAEKQGMFGYTIEQINDQLGDYLTTSAMYGTAQLASTKNATSSLVDLAANTSIMSDITKKSREEISKLANEAMRSALAIGGMSSIPLEVRDAAHKNMATVMSVFAAQQGEGAKMMTSMLGDTIGAGTAGLTEMGKTINGAGLGNLLSEMDVLADKVKTNSASQSDAISFSNDFKKSVEDNSAMLTQLAAAGNAQAAQMLEAASHMKYISAADMAAAKKDVMVRTGLTKLFGGLENAMGRILGSIQTGFYRGISPFLETLGKMADKACGWGYFEEKAKDFGAWIGNFLTTMLNAANIQKIEGILNQILNVGKAVVETTIGVGKILLYISPILSAVASGFLNIVEAAGTVGSTIGKFGDMIFGTGTKMQKTLGGVAAAVTLLFGPKLVKAVLSSFTKGFFGSKTIRAGVVNVYGGRVNGGGSGGGGGLGDLLGGGGGGAAANDNVGPPKGKWYQRLGTRLKSGILKLHPKNLFKGGHGRLGLALAGVGALGFGAMGMFGSSPAEAATPGGDAGVAPTTGAKPVPMKVMRSSMISDPKQRTQYESLLKERMALSQKPQDEATQARMAAIDEQMKGFNSRYGMSVSDPRDYNYASLNGKLPPGAKIGGVSVPQSGSTPLAAKQAGKKQAGGRSWLDAASIGLGMASFVPGLGIVSGIAGAGVDIARGDYTGAALSGLSAIPFAGDVAAAGKMAHMAGMAGTAAKLGSTSAKLGKNAILGSNAARYGVDAASMFGPSLFGAMTGGSAAADTADAGAAPDVDYTDPANAAPDSTPETDAIKRLTDNTEEQNKMIISLLARLNSAQTENTRLLSKLVTTRS